MSDAELGGLPGCPPPPAPVPRGAVRMGPGHVVLLEMNAENTKWAFVNLKRGQTACIGKHRAVSLDPLLGAPFGSTYEVNDDGILYPAERDPIGEWHQAKPTDDHRSNKSINDLKDNSAQGLTQEDIARLKAEGKSGDEIVAELCANSATFASKTAFAQEKYKKKKMMKHLTRVRARYPGARAVCEAYFFKQPAATNYMRYDALGMLLAYGNVGAHAQPLIVEMCGGLVTAAAAERMGGHGRVCAGYAGKSCNSLDITRLMNLTDAERSSIITMPLTELLRVRSLSGPAAAATATKKEGAEDGDDEAGKGEAEEAVLAGAAGTHDGGNGNENRGREAVERERPEGWVSRRINAASPEDIASLARPGEGFTSLVMAAPVLDPVSTLQTLLPLLAPSAPFAVWAYAAAPLAEALEDLRSSHVAVNLSLTEPWLRESQVLPGRTHPTMTTQAGAGGYVLSGNYIPPWSRGGKRRDEGREEGGACGKKARVD